MNKLKIKLAPMLYDRKDPRKNNIWRIFLFSLNGSALYSLTILKGRWAYYTQNVLQLGVFILVFGAPLVIVSILFNPIFAGWFDRFESKYGKFRPVL